MWRKIRPSTITVIIMHATAVGGVAIISVTQCFCDIPAWIEYALLMLINVIVGLVCGFMLKCCFHRRRYIQATVAVYWITYVIATVVIKIGESKNIFELLIILLLVMFSACVFR